jgi:hypothetical protein
VSFAEAAQRAAGAATGLLGWSPDAFWRATPAELLTAFEGRLPPDPGIGELKRMMVDDGRA